MQLKNHIIWLILLLVSAACSPNYQKLFSKHEFEKIRKGLDKSIKKDTLNPYANYQYSLFFLNTLNPSYHLDSSYFFVNEAIHDFYQTQPKAVAKLQKKGINDSTLFVQKNIIDSIAFSLAADTNTIRSYNVFIKKHPTALQHSEAIERRNDLAFREARKIDTYQSYQSFIETYPQAQQVAEARELYNSLLYRAKTKDGRLESFESFYRTYPESPYRKEAEKNIFEISTASNTIDSFENFIRSYPRSIYKKKAANWLFHVYKEDNPAEDFLKRFSDVPQKDSLSNIITTLKDFIVPYLEGQKYGFMNSVAQPVFDAQFENIDEDYPCGNITQDYLVVGDSLNKIIINRKGDVIYTKPFESVSDLGFGLLKLSNNGKFGVIHKAKYEVAPIEYEEIIFLNANFLKYKEDGYWGLMATTGRIIVDADYDDIVREGNFIFIHDNNKIAIINNQELIRKAADPSVKIEPTFDDADLVDNDHLIGVIDSMEILLKSNLQTIIPLDKHKIYDLGAGWMVKKDNKLRIFDEKMIAMPGMTFEKVEYNKKWIAAKRDKKWNILSNDAKFLPRYQVDSVRLLNENFSILYNHDTLSVLFANGKTISSGKQTITKVLRAQSTSSASADAGKYLLNTLKDGTSIVYDDNGNRLLSGNYDDVVSLGDEYFLLEKKQKRGLADSTGKILLQVRYDGIGNYHNGYVSVLQGSKFGIFNSKKKVNISPQYEKMLHLYNENLLTATKNSATGIVDLSNKRILPFEYSEIRYWNDTLALVQTDNGWQISHIHKSTKVSSAFEDYKLLQTTPEETVIRTQANGLFGLISSRKGELFLPTYNDVLNLGNERKPLYWLEKHVTEADYYVVIYADQDGKHLRTQAFDGNQYEKIYCF